MDSDEVMNILHNPFLFNIYSVLLFDEDEQNLLPYKFVAMCAGPEVYAKLEELKQQPEHATTYLRSNDPTQRNLEIHKELATYFGLKDEKDLQQLLTTKPLQTDELLEDIIEI